jgi:hypothetical protein
VLSQIALISSYVVTVTVHLIITGGIEPRA